MMKTTTLTLGALLLAVTNIAPAAATADDALLMQRMATCQDSWLDWKTDEARLTKFVDAVQTRYTRDARGPAFTPKAPTQMFGLQVKQLFPQSVGMALGFSMMVQADYAQTRRAVETQLGRTMSCTEDGEGRGCELKIGERKTIVVMAENGPAARNGTLLGCFYYYEQ